MAIGAIRFMCEGLKTDFLPKIKQMMNCDKVYKVIKTILLLSIVGQERELFLCKSTTHIWKQLYELLRILFVPLAYT